VVLACVCDGVSQCLLWIARRKSKLLLGFGGVGTPKASAHLGAHRVDGAVPLALDSSMVDVQDTGHGHQRATAKPIIALLTEATNPKNQSEYLIFGAATPLTFSIMAKKSDVGSESVARRYPSPGFPSSMALAKAKKIGIKLAVL